MKKHLLFLLFFLMMLPACIWAQQKSVYFLPEVAVFENINAWDFIHEGSDYPTMKAPATTGVSIGISCRKTEKNRIFFSWALGVTLNPQKLILNSYSNTSSASHTERFTNTDFWLRLMMGVNFLEQKNGFFDIAAGGKFIYGLRGKELSGTGNFEPYIDESTGEEYNYLATYRVLSWGDTRTLEGRVGAPAFLCFAGQVAYNFRLKNQKILRLALDFSSDFGTNRFRDYKNSGFESTFNMEKEKVGKTIFNDQYTQLGINVSITL